MVAVAEEDRRPSRRSEVRSATRMTDAGIRAQRIPLDQAGSAGRRRHLLAPRLLADAKFRPVPQPTLPDDWQGGFLCPCHGSTFDLAGRVFKNKPAPDNLQVPRHMYLSATPSWSSAKTRKARRNHGIRRKKTSGRCAGRCQGAELGRRPFPADQAVERPVGPVLRAEEFQLLVHLRLARDAGAGDPDRHRHFPRHALQAGCQPRVRVGRIHHARRAVGLAGPLHALDRRVGVLHRRLSAHDARPAVRLLPQAARADLAVRRRRSSCA